MFESLENGRNEAPRRFIQKARLGESYPAQTSRKKASRRISISPSDVGDKAPRGAFNEVLRTPKCQEQLQDKQSDVLMWEKQRSVRNQSPKVKTPFFLLRREEKIGIFRGYCGVQKLNKVVLPRVVLEAEEDNAILRRSHPRIVMPH